MQYLFRDTPNRYSGRLYRSRAVPLGVTAVVNLSRCEHLTHREGPTYLNLQPTTASVGRMWPSKQVRIVDPFHQGRWRFWLDVCAGNPELRKRLCKET
jgi:hypothetical protein